MFEHQILFMNFLAAKEEKKKEDGFPNSDYLINSNIVLQEG